MIDPPDAPQPATHRFSNPISQWPTLEPYSSPRLLSRFAASRRSAAHRPVPHNPHMQARNSPINRLSLTPDDVVGPRHVDGSSLPFEAHATVTETGAMPRSVDCRMTAMRTAFEASGGLLTVGELANGSEPHRKIRFAQIAKGIAAREIIGFMWQSEPWVPMFQFDTQSRLQPRPALQPLFRLLVPLYDAWEMANWFARPNQWLSGLKPVDACVSRLQAVLDVAHLEHFIATGQPPHQDPAPARSGGNG